MTPKTMTALALAALAALLAGVSSPAQGRAGNSVAHPRATSVEAAARVRGPVVAVAGDIATDGNGDRATAAVVRRINPRMVLTVGDHAYPYGSKSYFALYDATWGAFKGRTRPSPGNHEYASTSGSRPYYYTYFSGQLPDRHGGQYYAFNIGSWRLYSLNCEIPCGEGSAQLSWLRNDLAARGAGRHKLAYLHRPRYSCGSHGSDTKPDALWDALRARRADLVLAGHDHNYQRYPRMSSNNTVTSRGMMSFVVGTGGASTYPIDGTEPEEGCAKARYTQSRHLGVLRLRLGANKFSWAFVSTGNGVLDSGVTRVLDPSGG
jgi:acid phosphatase type 7